MLHGFLVKVRRFKPLIALTLVVLLFSNISLTSAAPLNSKGMSKDKSTPVNSAAWRKFQDDPVLTQLIEESGVKGFKMKNDAPVFAPLSNGAVSVTVGGFRGQNQMMIITGFYDPTTEQMIFSQAYEFQEEKDTIRVNAKIHSRGKTTNVSMDYDRTTREWKTRDGVVLDGVYASYTCQTTECEMTYEFWGLLVCGIVGLLTEGFGFWLCEMVWQAFVKWICFEVLYPDC